MLGLLKTIIHFQIPAPALLTHGF